MVDGVLEVIQRLTLAMVRLAPVGIFALLAREVARRGVGIMDPGAVLPHRGARAPGPRLRHPADPAVVFGRRSPVAYLRPGGAGAGDRVLHRFVVGDPAAEHGVRRASSREPPKGVSSFVLPLGATVNMDGTALYEAVAALTIAQMYGVGARTLPQQASGADHRSARVGGAAGIPMAGLVMLVVVLEAVGLPLEGIATIIAVDRVLDMMRTATNVWSDLVGTAVVNRFEGRAE